MNSATRRSTIHVANSPSKSPSRALPMVLIGLAVTLTSGPFASADEPSKQGDSSALSISQSKRTITIHHGDETVLVYNIKSPPTPPGMDPVYRRSGFLHPVCTPNGAVVTAAFPVDHAHQDGVFSAWVRARYDGHPVDFWNLPGRTGRVLHERVVASSVTSDRAEFEVDLIHRIQQPLNLAVLRERWKITAYPTAGDHYRFDLETIQTALTDKPLIVERYHYGGVALRGPTAWLLDEPPGGQHPDNKRPASRFLNHYRSGRIKGNHQHTKWVSLSGMLHNSPATVTVLCHADNFRAPQAARLHPRKPYFCFAPCVDGPFTIDRQHPYHARYRFLLTDDEPDAEWIDRQWQKWCGPPAKQ